MRSIFICISLMLVFIAGFGAIFWYRAPLRWLPHSRLLTRTKDRHRQARLLCRQSKKCLRYLRKEARVFSDRPEAAGDMVSRLRYLLPNKGILTEERANLRILAQHIRNDHVAQLERNRYLPVNIPAKRKRRAATDLSMRINQLIRINRHLEELDIAAAEHEQRISTLIQLAENYAVGGCSLKLYGCLKAAEKIQHHNDKLLKMANRTERRLEAIARRTAARNYMLRTWEKYLNKNPFYKPNQQYQTVS